LISGPVLRPDPQLNALQPTSIVVTYRRGQSIRIAAALLTLLGQSVAAQASGVASSGAGIVADPKDVASPEAIVAALYDALSGTATQQRNWDRFRGLFIAEGRLIPAAVNAQGQPRIRAFSPGAYAKEVDPQLKKEGFYEHEIARTTESFGNIMHVFSTYESRHALSDPQPFGRGINSIQLFNDGRRWWIVTVLWDRERANNPLPAKFLPGARRPGVR
jgi:hypothetical protein